MPVSVPYNKRTHCCGSLRKEHVGQTAILAGWVNSYRDHGGMVFIDLRDHEGITQLKFNPETDPDAHTIAGSLRNEDVIALRGDVAHRKGNINPGQSASMNTAGLGARLSRFTGT